ncbi:MAG: AbrB/MazE/SpoVT family DNA-binding domain-containing protein [Candidatus Liptonbacteria bacterium]|nr:AbrB/MazE/SpoVT family DNA-binding domain-containing protein [Candidatus Liptonbacteria bacterium]
MARRKLSDENIRKIQKTSRSYYVTIPVQLIREFGWEAGREVVVEKSGPETAIIHSAEGAAPFGKRERKRGRRIAASFYYRRRAL